MLMCVRWPEDPVTASIGITLQPRATAEQMMIDGDIATAFVSAVAAYLTDPLSLFAEMA